MCLTHIKPGARICRDNHARRNTFNIRAMQNSSIQSGIPDGLWSAVYQNTQEAVLISDASGRIIDVNQAFTKITGYTREEAIGQSTNLLKSGYQDASFYKRFWRTLNTEGRWQGEIWNRRKDGNVYPEFITVSSIRDAAGKVVYFIAIFYDIGFVSSQTERFKHLAHHDALTGLPNRLALSLFLPQAIERARRQGTYVVVGMLDLDDFKPVNDTFGHKAGDDLLRAIAHRLKDSVRGTDLVIRLGGDEFVIVLEGLIHESEIYPCLDRIGAACEAPFMLPDAGEIRIALSLGWTLYPEDDPDSTDSANLLLRNADMALYVAKADKLHRTSWHHRWGQTCAVQKILTQGPRIIDGYGEECRRILRLGAQTRTIAEASKQFATEFYASLGTLPEPARILTTLSDEEQARLTQRQAEHLEALMQADLTREQHRERARFIGKIHALIGLQPSTLVNAMGIYLQILTDRIIAMPGRVADRASLVQVVNVRLKEELQYQLEATEELQAHYRHYLIEHARNADAKAPWGTQIQACLDRLCELPGIAAAAWGYRAPDGIASVKYASGSFNAYAEALRQAGLETRLALESSTTSASTVAKAWASNTLVINPSYMHDPHHARWRDVATRAGIRSSAAFPLMGTDGPVGVVSVYGQFPGQFENSFMRDFLLLLAAGLQHRLDAGESEHAPPRGT